MQAEKKIRLKSLVKMGFLMNEIQDIFSRCNEATFTAMKRSGEELMNQMGDFDFRNKFNISDSDEAIIFYTAGFIVRGLLKRTKCTSCTKILSCNNEPLQIRFATDVPPKEEFLTLCSRGGRIKPSDLVQVTCDHAWSLYSYIDHAWNFC